MSTESVRKYKGCLSYEQTERAWIKQNKGASCVSVALDLNVDISTIYRSYQHYGFSTPRNKYNKGKKYRIKSGRADT